MQGLILSIAEVIAICGFVFGVACKLPPCLIILLLNGVFWVVIARHLIWDIAYKRINHHMAGYRDVEEYRDGRCTLFLKRKLVPSLEGFALLLQLSALVVIPILLAYRKDKYDGDGYLIVWFLIPGTLTVISVVWSGWLQKYLVKPRSKRPRVALADESCSARLKSGEYTVFQCIEHKIVSLIPTSKPIAICHFYPHQTHFEKSSKPLLLFREHPVSIII